MREIKLTNNMIALVDDEDFEYLNQFKWCAHKNNISDTYYADRSIYFPKKQTIKMHREVMGLKAGDHQIVDHVNWNGLDNRKENLRLANKSINGLNQKMSKNNTSGYRGVSWFVKLRKWRVQINISGKKTHIGYFDNILDAAEAYNKKVISLYKEKLPLNIIS